jgi:hypothetical protein
VFNLWLPSPVFFGPQTAILMVKINQELKMSSIRRIPGKTLSLGIRHWSSHSGLCQYLAPNEVKLLAHDASKGRQGQRDSLLVEFNNDSRPWISFVYYYLKFCMKAEKRKNNISGRNNLSYLSQYFRKVERESKAEQKAGEKTI